MKLTFKNHDENMATKYQEFFPERNCFIEGNPGKVVLPRKYPEIAEAIINLPVYEDDIWLVSYPRTGSTWAQEMIWLLANKLDYEGAKQMQAFRAPLLELSAVFGQDHNEWLSNSIGNTVDCVRNTQRPRFTKSHLPWQLLPAQFESIQPKIVYTARNPKDLCVSYYHYCKLIHGMDGPFDGFCELFITDKLPYGSYWNHVLPVWKRRYDPNILFLKYEDMKRNLPTIIRQCAEFLEIGYKLTENDIDKMCEYLKFDKMQSNPAVNLEPLLNNPDAGLDSALIGNGKFIRKGQIGDWTNFMSPELSQRFDKWIKAHTDGTGLLFDYE